MSNAAAAATEVAPAPAKSKKMLLIIAAAVVLVLVLGAVGAMLLLKPKAADAEDEDGEPAKPAKAAKVDPKAVPTFVPLDQFVVNLADRDAERYAQVGITLEVVDAKHGDQIKALMPAIRHTVLMLLAEKTAAQLIDRDGKHRFARQVQRETSRVLGAEVPDEPAGDAEGETAPAKADGKAGKKKAKKAPPELPVRAVHFSSFIVQ